MIHPRSSLLCVLPRRKKSEGVLRPRMTGTVTNPDFKPQLQPQTTVKGEADFTSGLTYVALSRVRKLTDLLLEPFQWKRYESIGEGEAAVNFREELKRLDRLATNTRGRLRAPQPGHS